MRPTALRKMAAACGIAGPALFTAAWAISSWRQTGHAAQVQLSGLAAPDARDPQIMIAGFTTLGACTIAFGTGLGRALGTRSAWLVTCAGAAGFAAGLLRRDHMLLIGPGFAGESWHNQAHDLVSGVAYAAMIAAPLALARRFRGDPDWSPLRRPLVALALASAAAMVVFSTRAIEPAIIQKIAVTLPLAAESLTAWRLFELSRRATPGGTAGLGGQTDRGLLARSSTL